MARTRSVALVAVALLGVAAYRDGSHKTGLSAVRIGMTQQEVERIAGRPVTTMAAPCIGTTPVYWIYEGTFPNDMKSTILFVRDRVAMVVERSAVLASAPDQLAESCSGAGAQGSSR